MESANTIRNSVPPYNPALTLIKVFAFIGIMLFHLGLLPIGSQGIVVFVICSGYGYLYLYQKRVGGGYWKTFSHQAQKLLVALLLCYFIIIVLDITFFHRYTLSKIAASYLLIFCGVFVSEMLSIINYGLFAMGSNIQVPNFPSNSVLWFVSLIMWLYLLFPALRIGMESRYRFLLLIFLLILSFVVRDYSLFPYPSNSISANLLNFYVGMLCFKYESGILETMSKNRLVSMLFFGVLIALYTVYGESLNRVATYGMFFFYIMYFLLSMEVDFLEGSRKCLYGLNSLIMFLVFLHIPAQCIQDVILKVNGRNDWTTLVFSYVAYFSYTIILAVVTAWIYGYIRARLMQRFKSAMKFGIQSRVRVDRFL